MELRKCEDINSKLQIILSFTLILIQLIFKESIKSSIVIICLQLVLLFYKSIKKKISIDSTTLIYAFYCISILILSMFQSGKEYFWGNFYSLLIGLAVFVINRNIEVKQLNKKVFFAVISISIVINLQAIFKFIELSYKSKAFLGSGYRNDFILQFGKSNALGIWFVAVICILLDYKKYVISKILIVLSTISMMLLLSRSTILIFILLIFFRSKKKIKMVIKAMCLAICTYAICLLNTKYVAFYFSKLLRLDRISNINNISSGRVEIYRALLESMDLKTVFLGKGLGNLSYMDNYICAHNVLIEVFLTAGIVGFIIFSILNIDLFRRLKNNSLIDSFRRSTFIIFILAFTQALLEPTFYTSPKINIFIWTIIGISMSKSRKDDCYNKQIQVK